MTKKQLWIKKRNQLILRLVDAKSIFSRKNTIFMEDATNMNQAAIYRCEDAIDRLIKVMEKVVYQEAKGL